MVIMKQPKTLKIKIIMKEKDNSLELSFFILTKNNLWGCNFKHIKRFGGYNYYGKKN